MAELPDKQRRNPGSRGLRGRSRTRTADGGNNSPSGTSSGGTDAPKQARNAQSARNGPQSNRRTKQNSNRQNRQGGGKQQLDSESDFRASRQSGGLRQPNGFSDDLLLGNTGNNGNRNRPTGRRHDSPVSGNRRQGKPTQNGNYRTASDTVYTGLQELRGSDWYREDQARYARQQIANENSGTGGGESHSKNGAGTGSAANKRNNGQQRGRNRRNNNNRTANNQKYNTRPGATGNTATDTRAKEKVEASPVAVCAPATEPGKEAKPAAKAATGASAQRRPARRKSPPRAKAQATAAPDTTDQNSEKKAAPIGDKETVTKSAKASPQQTNGAVNSTSSEPREESTGREAGKSRRAPWRTQKHSASSRKGDSST